MWCLKKEIILHYSGSFETLMISDSRNFQTHCGGVIYRNLQGNKLNLELDGDWVEFWFAQIVLTFL